MKRTTFVAACFLGGAALILVHLWLIGPILQNGDAAVYNEQIEARLLNVRTTHWGYIALGIIANASLPFDVERNINLMNLALAALGGVSIFTITRNLGTPSTFSAFASLLTFAIPTYLRGAVLGEVDVVACGLILFATSAWVRGNRVTAGIGFGAAMLTTPLAALSLPVFLVSRASTADSTKSWMSRAKDVVTFAVVSLLVYAPVVVYNWQDYWHGGRGILHAPNEPWNFAEQITRSIRFFVSAPLALFVLCVVGLLVALWHRSSLAYGTTLAIAFAAVFGERFLDVPVQMPQLCLLVPFAVALVARTPKRSVGLLVLTVAWAISALPTYRAVLSEVTTKKHRRAEFLEMAKQTPKFYVVGLSSSWDEGLPFERIVYGKTKLGLGLDLTQFARSSFGIARTKKDHALWLVAPVPSQFMTPFRNGWTRETRNVLGSRYDVWLPMRRSGT